MAVEAAQTGDDRTGGIGVLRVVVPVKADGRTLVTSHGPLEVMRRAERLRGNRNSATPLGAVQLINVVEHLALAFPRAAQIAGGDLAGSRKTWVSSGIRSRISASMSVHTSWTRLAFRSSSNCTRQRQARWPARAAW